MAVDCIKLPSLDISLDLTVPHCPVELQEPGPKLCQLFRRKRFNLLFEIFNPSHDPSFRPVVDGGDGINAIVRALAVARCW